MGIDLLVNCRYFHRIGLILAMRLKNLLTFRIQGHRNRQMLKTRRNLRETLRCFEPRPKIREHCMGLVWQGLLRHLDYRVVLQSSFKFPKALQNVVGTQVGNHWRLWGLTQTLDYSHTHSCSRSFRSNFLSGGGMGRGKSRGGGGGRGRSPASPSPSAILPRPIPSPERKFFWTNGNSSETHGNERERLHCRLVRCRSPHADGQVRPRRQCCVQQYKPILEEKKKFKLTWIRNWSFLWSRRRIGIVPKNIFREVLTSSLGGKCCPHKGVFVPGLHKWAGTRFFRSPEVSPRKSATARVDFFLWLQCVYLTFRVQGILIQIIVLIATVEHVVPTTGV